MKQNQQNFCNNCFRQIEIIIIDKYMYSKNLEKSDISKIGKIANYLYVGLAMSLANPIDLIRFRMQTMPELIKQGTLAKPYKSVFDCMKRVISEEGKNALLKGNMSNLLKFYPAQGMNWAFKELFQSRLKRYPHYDGKKLDNTFLVNYCGGALAGLLTRTILYPLEHTRNIMSNDISRKNKGIWDCLKTTYEKAGVRGIYKGALVSFVGVAIFRSTYFGIYDTFKNKTQNSFERWCVSYLGVFCAISLTYPSDTIRRRLMLTTCQKYQYDGFLDCTNKILKKQGCKSLFRGWGIIFFQSIVSATIYFIFDKITLDIKNLQGL